MEYYKTVTYSPETFQPTYLETEYPNDLVQSIIKLTDYLEFISKGKYNAKHMYYPKTDKVIIGVFDSENNLTPFKITIEKK